MCVFMYMPMHSANRSALQKPDPEKAILNYLHTWTHTQFLDAFHRWKTDIQDESVRDELERIEAEISEEDDFTKVKTRRKYATKVLRALHPHEETAYRMVTKRRREEDEEVCVCVCV